MNFIKKGLHGTSIYKLYLLLTNSEDKRMGKSIITHDELRRHVRGIFQVGIGEFGEEKEWIDAEVKNQIYVEPIERHYKNHLKRIIPSDTVHSFNCALSNENGTKPFYICNNDDSCSLYPISPNIPEFCNWMRTDTSIPMVVKTLDSLVAENNIDMSLFNLLYMDTQGSEHEIIEGARDNIHFFDIIVAEIFYKEIYTGPKMFSEWEGFMESFGFRLKRKHDFHDGVFTDAVFVKIGSPWDKEV